MKTANLLVRTIPGLLVGSLLILSDVALSQQPQPDDSAVGRKRNTPNSSNRDAETHDSRPRERFNRRRGGRRGGRAADSIRGPAHVVVFHGHDHFFAKQDVDGIVYQLVPQPGADERGRVRVAESYGYTHGDILSSPGHLRVRVSPKDLRVDYVRSRLPADQRRRGRNGDVAYSYTIHADL